MPEFQPGLPWQSKATGIAGALGHHCAPDRFQRQRHVDLRHTQRREGVEHRADDRGGRGDRSGFPAAFSAKWVVRAGLSFIELGHDGRTIGCAWNGMVR
jgi:hypothetical protein